jgi:hypothetical protein
MHRLPLLAATAAVSAASDFPIDVSRACVHTPEAAACAACCEQQAAWNCYHLTKSKLACVGFVRVMFICLPYAQIALLTCVLAHEFLAAL